MNEESAKSRLMAARIAGRAAIAEERRVAQAAEPSILAAEIAAIPVPTNFEALRARALAHLRVALTAAAVVGDASCSHDITDTLRVLIERVEAAEYYVTRERMAALLCVEPATLDDTLCALGEPRLSRRVWASSEALDMIERWSYVRTTLV